MYKKCTFKWGQDRIYKCFKEYGSKYRNRKGKLLNGEPVGNIYVKESYLKGITVERHITPNIIDEIPVLSVIAAFSEGKLYLNL